jgi:predicted  nucleic acid-binding Zn-ribbon protein
MSDFTSHIPIELMELLNKINDNINEVKERIVRLEAQDHAETFKGIKADIEKERDERIKLQIELANVKTRLAPIVIGISMIGAGVIEFAFRTLY